MKGSPHSGPVLTPAEVLIAIHGIDPDRDGIPLKKVTDACNACFEQQQTFTQEVLAKVLNQLVEQIPLPLLFMRTVLQAIGAFPALVGDIYYRPDLKNAALARLSAVNRSLKVAKSGVKKPNRQAVRISGRK